jgi:hypothetical protein
MDFCNRYNQGPSPSPRVRMKAQNHWSTPKTAARSSTVLSGCLFGGRLGFEFGDFGLGGLLIA